MKSTPTTQCRAADGISAVQTVATVLGGGRQGNTVNPIGADGDDTNDLGGAASVGEGI